VIVDRFGAGIRERDRLRLADRLQGVIAIGKNYSYVIGRRAL